MCKNLNKEYLLICRVEVGVSVCARSARALCFREVEKVVWEKRNPRNQALCCCRAVGWGWWSCCQPGRDHESLAVVVAPSQPGIAWDQGPVLLPGAGGRVCHGACRGSALEMLVGWQGLCSGNPGVRAAHFRKELGFGGCSLGRFGAIVQPHFFFH